MNPSIHYYTREEGGLVFKSLLLDEFASLELIPCLQPQQDISFQDKAAQKNIANLL